MENKTQLAEVVYITGRAEKANRVLRNMCENLEGFHRLGFDLLRALLKDTGLKKVRSEKTIRCGKDDFDIVFLSQDGAIVNLFYSPAGYSYCVMVQNIFDYKQSYRLEKVLRVLKFVKTQSIARITPDLLELMDGKNKSISGIKLKIFASIQRMTGLFKK